jgi:hypothetical protein
MPCVRNSSLILTNLIEIYRGFIPSVQTHTGIVLKLDRDVLPCPLLQLVVTEYLTLVTPVFMFLVRLFYSNGVYISYLMFRKSVERVSILKGYPKFVIILAPVILVL